MIIKIFLSLYDIFANQRDNQKPLREILLNMILCGLISIFFPDNNP